MAASVAAQAGIGVVAQILLARWLSSHDFGLFALAVSASFPFAAFGDGGVRIAMTQQTADSIEQVAPGAFRFALLASLAFGTLLVLLGSPIASLFGESDLVGLLVLTAAVFPVKAYAAVTIPYLQVNLRFRQVAVVMLSSILIQYTTSLILAVLGMGAASLVIGALVGFAGQAVLLYAVSRYRPWTTRASWRKSWRVMALTKWPTGGEVATNAAGRVDYFVLGLFVPTRIVGGYYFAYQLVVRLGELVIAVARNVLFPVLSRFRLEAHKQLAGVHEAGRMMAVAAGVGAAFVISSMDAVESLLWAGKWAWVVPAITLLATVLPVQVALSSPEQLLKARAQFRTWTFLLIWRAAGVGIVAVGIGLVGGSGLTPTVIAGWIAGFIAVEALAEIAFLARVTGFSGSLYAKQALVPWVLLVGIGWLGSLVSGVVDGQAASVTVAILVVGIGSLGVVGAMRTISARPQA